MFRNILIAVGIQSTASYVLDPVLDLCNPGIDTMAGTLTAVADYANLGKSKGRFAL